MNKDSYTVYDTKIYYRNETERNPESGWINHDFHHFGTLHRVLNMLRDEGFEIEPDKTVDELIRKDYFRGRRGDLELQGHRYPAGFEITFFQNVNFENRYGGEHDFDKFKKMPYMIKLRYIKYMRKIIDFLNYMIDLDNKSDYRYKLSEDQIKAFYVREWHHEQTDMNFRLSDLDGQTQEPYNGLDRDGKTLRNGDMKYWRYRDGRIWRGKVYHNINNMWWVIVNKYEFHNVACFELFDLTPDDYLGRNKKAKVPENYQKRREAISSANAKELINELKRRGIAVKTERK